MTTQTEWTDEVRDRIARELVVQHGYTTYQAVGAIPNGTVVLKVESEPGDTHSVGTQATVVGSLPTFLGPKARGLPFYFVKFADVPVPIGILGWKIGYDQ